MSDDYDPWFDVNHPMNVRTARRLSIAELEQMLRTDDEVPIEILPNGEIRTRDSGDRKVKVLTYRENLGGEYGSLAA
jgi:hypothetical protein